ncbi:MAG: hypothetical protein H6737_16740 [Alphaproteobacteria bacterium]|nr:hypothetical protein [Alphaproteobacteria bacterium]
MALPALDPHPLGCPLGIALTPDEMQAAVVQICLHLHDLMFPTVHVVNPSKGKSYPMLNLHTQRGDGRPRLVIFPGWEDQERKRRVEWKRQSTLMKRIADAGVEGETLDLNEKERETEGPFETSLACTAAQMDQMILDLNAYLGDIMRITVGTIKQTAKADIKVVRLYAPNSEKKPRLIFYPGWTGESESEEARVDDEMRAKMRHKADRTAEVPVEIYVQGLK